MASPIALRVPGDHRLKEAHERSDPPSAHANADHPDTDPDNPAF
jgi:hypothetical protein